MSAQETLDLANALATKYFAFTCLPFGLGVAIYSPDNLRIVNGLCITTKAHKRKRKYFYGKNQHKTHYSSTKVARVNTVIRTMSCASTAAVLAKTSTTKRAMNFIGRTILSLCIENNFGKNGGAEGILLF